MRHCFFFFYQELSDLLFMPISHFYEVKIPDIWFRYQGYYYGYQIAKEKYPILVEFIFYLRKTKEQGINK